MTITTRPHRTPCATSRPATGHVNGPGRTASPRRRHRLAAMALVAVAACAVPHPAAALMPLPPPPVRLPIQVVARTVLTLAEAYVEASLTERRRLRNELLLTLNTTRAAI